MANQLQTHPVAIPRDNFDSFPTPSNPENPYEKANKQIMKEQIADMQVEIYGDGNDLAVAISVVAYHGGSSV
ncbi:hypothetical protein LOK49_LG02G02056 [Camellia lanceoleosa]|uniref:Uncharacterized protein n=1 Tax=Camellia lanceoleosa TaxID=1840588 RepID=A0ACC0INI2_9ERIC|nr:hypothetical protein LOK49_LG02G02056 [Camellia lanceoleosa]